jgi:VanZ family protein
MTSIFKISFLIALMSIEFLATTTTVHIELVESMWDKANHFVAFFTLYILLSLSYKEYHFFVKFFVLFLFGLQIEIVQYFIDGRDFSLLDLFADSVALVVASVFYALYERVTIIK